MKHEETYILTDGCGWEITREKDNEHPHAIEVVNIKTGAVRFIKSGSKIKLVEGEISDLRSQETYNEMPRNGQNKPLRIKRKGTGKKAHNESKEDPRLSL